MKRKNSPGKELERLVAALERVLHRSGATIEAPCRRLVDRDTGQSREHDVVITWDHGHHQIVTAIECRDRSRPVGVPDVEAFADKCTATGVQSGVMVSTAGFRTSARTKAQARGITCMDLSDAEQFDWLGTNIFTGYNRRISKVTFKLPSGQLSRTTFNGEVYNPEGQPVSIEQLARAAISHIPLGPLPDEPLGKEHQIIVPLETKGWTVLGKDGNKHPVETIRAIITTELTATETGISMHRYAGNGKDYNVASADIPMPDTPGKIVMIQNDDGSTSIYLVPEKRETPSKSDSDNA